MTVLEVSLVILLLFGLSQRSSLQIWGRQRALAGIVRFIIIVSGPFMLSRRRRVSVIVGKISANIAANCWLLWKYFLKLYTIINQIIFQMVLRG